MGTTVDGLISGLDTTNIIAQLMQLQAAPQTRLKNSLTAEQSAVSAFQAVNTKMSALQAAGEALGKATTWGAATASSTSASVTATAAAGALTGSTTFSVTQLATAKSMVSTQTYDSLTDTSKIQDSVLEIRSGPGGTGAVLARIQPADGSLQALVTAINGSPDAGVRAAAVQVSPGVYKLQLTSTQTGSGKDFGLTAEGGVPPTGMTFSQVSAAQDAVLHVGDAGAGFDITSGSNTIEGVMPGVTVKVTAKATDVTVSIGSDQASITSAVQAFVDAANSALVTIKSLSSVGVLGTDGARTGVGALAGDGQMRQLTQQILSSVTNGVGGTSLSTVGVSVNKDGILVFDGAAFGKSLTADAAATKAKFTTATTGGTGLADVLASLSKGASSSTGTIASSIAGRQSTITDLTDRIADWDTRLASRKEALQRQYASLETALGKLKSQSTWLAGQLSALDNNGSNS